MGIFDRYRYKKPLKIGIKPVSEKPYIFASFDRCDAEKVFNRLNLFSYLGLNVWYDYGTVKGNDWIETISEKIESCSLFLVFISKSSVESQNVRNQIMFASSEEKPICAIYLEDTELKYGLELILANQKDNNTELLTKYIKKHASNNDLVKKILNK